MRAASLLPLALAATMVTACGSEVASVSQGEAAAGRTPVPPERDLTLQAPPASETEVASAVELSRPRPEPVPNRAVRSRPRPKPAPPPPQPEPAAVPAAEPVPAPAPAEAPQLLAGPATEEAAPNGRELAPGETITVIPVSSGPSVEADEDDSWLPSERPRGIWGGRGGTCRPRGGVRGIGIAGRIPVGIPARHLR